MADARISELTALSTTPATGDLLAIVDVSDTTDGASGTTKKIAAGYLGGLVSKETPSGSHDGSNLVYSLTHTVIPNTIDLVVQGQVWTEGIDYTVTGLSLNQITLTTALPAGFTGTFIAKYNYAT